MKLYFFKKSNGKEPVREGLDTLPLEEKADAYSRLKGVQQYGFDYSRVTFKKVDGKLWEIKYKYKNQHRIFYCMKDVKTMYLLHYIKKKTQKIELRDKEIAEKRMIEVLRDE